MALPDFAKGASGPAEPYDVSAAGLGISPAYLAQGASASASGFSGTLPSGSILAYGGSVAPAGYLLCDGSTYDGTQSTYSNLWSAIGVTYGGSGQSAFQVPDLRGRVVVGYAASGGHTDVATRGNNDGVALANRRPKHNSTNSLTLPNHIHNTTFTAVYSSPGTTGFTTGDGELTEWGTAGWLTESVAKASGNPTTNPAIGGSIGPGGTAPVDAPAYMVLNYIVAL